MGKKIKGEYRMINGERVFFAAEGESGSRRRRSAGNYKASKGGLTAANQGKMKHEDVSWYKPKPKKKKKKRRKKK